MIRGTILALAIGPSLAFAAAPMEPGRWESTVTVVRAGQVPVVSSDVDCVTQREIDDGTKSIPKPGENCELANLATADGTTTYDFACRDGDLVRTGHATFTLEAQRYDGKLDVVTRKGKGPEVATTMTWSAQRTGACQ
jgi:hypothetical protein